MDFSFSTLMAGMIFSSVGFLAWRYGRQQQSARPMLLGAALFIVPFAMDGTALWVVGAILSILVWWP